MSEDGDTFAASDSSPEVTGDSPQAADLASAQKVLHLPGNMGAEPGQAGMTSTEIVDLWQLSIQGQEILEPSVNPGSDWISSPQPVGPFSGDQSVPLAGSQIDVTGVAARFVAGNPAPVNAAERPANVRFMEAVQYPPGAPEEPVGPLTEASTSLSETFTSAPDSGLTSLLRWLGDSGFSYIVGLAASVGAVSTAINRSFSLGPPHKLAATVGASSAAVRDDRADPLGLDRFIGVYKRTSGPDEVRTYAVFVRAGDGWLIGGCDDMRLNSLGSGRYSWELVPYKGHSVGGPLIVSPEGTRLDLRISSKNVVTELGDYDYFLLSADRQKLTLHEAEEHFNSGVSFIKGATWTFERINSPSEQAKYMSVATPQFEKSWKWSSNQ